MDDIFLKILNMGITASWLILAVVLLRFLLKKAPKWLSCALWAAVAIRLICPVSFESALSLVPSAETVRMEILHAQAPTIYSGIPALNHVVNPALTEAFAPAPGASVNPLQLWTSLASDVWLLGIAALLGYAAVSYLRLRKKMGASIHVRDTLWMCDDIKTPFILGVVSPRIYLPSGMDAAQQSQVIAHETAHLKRRDHWWKPLGFLLLAVYWFHPLCWLAYILLCRDIELDCDEKVIRAMGKDDRIAYSEALLSCSSPGRMVMACPLAFGEVGVKERIKTVLGYKKPAFWLVLAAVMACVLVAVCFLTNPQTHETMKWAQQLSVDEVDHIELVTFPQSADRQYQLFSRDEQADIVALINESRGKRAEHPEGLAGGSCFFYLTMTDRTQHVVGTIGNTYLVIDGDYYEADDHWLATWDAFREGNAPLPEGFLEGRLTLEDVVAAAQKGTALSWADFEGYPYIETGSGLYIRLYEIDGLFSLWIGGIGLSQEPSYIHLGAHDDVVEIRSGEVEDFIRAHQEAAGEGRVEPAYESVYAWVNYSEDGYNAMVAQAENRDTERQYGNVEDLTPLVKLETKAEYDAFCTEMSEYFSFTQNYEESVSFSEQANGYTEDFFAVHALFIAYLTEPASSIRHEIEEIRGEDGGLEIRICRMDPDVGDTVMAGWFLAVAIPKADTAGWTAYDAYICATNHPNRTAPMGALVHTYAREDEELAFSTSITLYDSGEFIFSFSPVSSYLGHGEYTMEHDRLTLKTEDGNYTYVFDMVDDTLRFDADVSSDMLWYSGMADGDIFTMEIKKDDLTS